MHSHEECRKLLNSLSDYVDGDLQQELCDERFPISNIIRTKPCA
jgi:hypothetical protein